MGRAEKEDPDRDGIGRGARGNEGGPGRAAPAIRAYDHADHRPRHGDHTTLLAGAAGSFGRRAETVSALTHHQAMISRSCAAAPSRAEGEIPQSAITPIRSFPLRIGTVRSAL